MREQTPAIDLAKRLSDLLNISFLEDSSLMTNVSLAYLAQGQTLFEQGEEAKSCFLVVSGSIKVIKKSENAESILTIISKGEFGGALLMSPHPENYPGSVVALSQAVVLTIPKDTFINHWMKHPTALAYINTCVRNRMRHLQQDKLLQLSKVEDRVIQFLKRHYLEKRDLCTIKMTRKEISLAVGAKTETVIRILQKLEKAGMIKTQRSVITVLDKSFIQKD